MKKIILISGFISLTTLLFSQLNENLTDGYKVFKYPNGTISSEGIIRNGKPDGFW
jgi:antitoxin component YwqK of YwqJK toxin-antitoxin module